MDNDQPKLNPVTLASYIKEMGLKDKFEKWEEAQKPEAVKSKSSGLLGGLSRDYLKNCAVGLILDPTNNIRFWHKEGNEEEMRANLKLLRAGVEELEAALAT